MAGPFDAVGQWLNDHGISGGASSGPGVKSEYVQNGPGGLHQFSVMTDGTLKDNGVIDPKSAQAKPQIVKDDAGGVYAYLPNPGNPDNPFTRQTIIAPDASKASFAQSQTDKNDADVQGIYQRMADATAMLPYNKDKATAMIANLNSEVSSRGARTQIDQQKLQGQLSRWASQNGVDTSKIGLNNAHGDLYGAQADKLLQGAFLGLQQQYAQIDSLVGQPGGPADQAAADALKKQVFDQVARQAATGLTANQAATNATTQRGQDITQQDTQRGQDVTQGDTRAGQLSSFLTGYGHDLTTAKMPPGSTGAGDFLGAMMNAWPGLMANAGAAPVAPTTASGPTSAASPAPATAGPVSAPPLPSSQPAPTNGVAPSMPGSPDSGMPSGQGGQGSGVSVNTLRPEIQQQLHDRTQALTASGMPLNQAASQALQEWMSSYGSGGASTPPPTPDSGSGTGNAGGFLASMNPSGTQVFQPTPTLSY